MGEEVKGGDKGVNEVVVGREGKGGGSEVCVCGGGGGDLRRVRLQPQRPALSLGPADKGRRVEVEALSALCCCMLQVPLSAAVAIALFPTLLPPSSIPCLVKLDSQPSTAFKTALKTHLCNNYC